MALSWNADATIGLTRACTLTNIARTSFSQNNIAECLAGLGYPLSFEERCSLLSPPRDMRSLVMYGPRADADMLSLSLSTTSSRNHFFYPASSIQKYAPCLRCASTRLRPDPSRPPSFALALALAPPLSLSVSLSSPCLSRLSVSSLPSRSLHLPSFSFPFPPLFLCPLSHAPAHKWPEREDLARVCTIAATFLWCSSLRAHVCLLSACARSKRAATLFAGLHPSAWNGRLLHPFISFHSNSFLVPVSPCPPESLPSSSTTTRAT